jgi:hypothetical protein
MKIVFLDIDGVLNSKAYWMKIRGPGVDVDDKLDPEAIKRLNRIIAVSGARIVLSSTWRMGYVNDMPGLRQLFVDNGIAGDVIDITPIDARTRGEQIQDWLNKQEKGSIESFVIIDDDSDMGKRLSKRLIKTSFEFGLLDEHVLAAILTLTRTCTSNRSGVRSVNDDGTDT